MSILVAFVASITPANARGCFYTGSAGMDLQPDVHALGQWRCTRAVTRQSPTPEHVPQRWKKRPQATLPRTHPMRAPTPQQREMAARAHAHTVEIVSSHADILAHPSQVAAFIEHSAAASH